MLFPFLAKGMEIDLLAGVVRKNKKGNDVHPWLNYRISPQEVRRELKELNGSCCGRIFSSYRLDKNCYGLYSLDCSGAFMIPHNKLDNIAFSILDISVHSFETGIAFLELKYRINSDNEQDALNFNYYLSELKANIELCLLRSQWNEEKREKESVTEVITVTNLLKRLLDDFGGVTDIDFDGNMKSYSSKPVLFSYLLLDNPDEDIVKHLGLNMKSSYKINNDVLTQTKCFDNSTWMYSLNSTVNATLMTSDEITNDFFKTTFIDKVEKLYFYLFLQSLHQRFFLQMCHYKIRSYNFDLATLDENKKLIDALSGYSANFNKARLKYFFDSPSSIDHVNTFYAAMRDSLGIQDHVASITADLKVMMTYVDQKYKLFDEYSKLVSDKKQNRLDLIAFFVASIISFVSIYDTFLKMLSNFGVTLTPDIHILLAVIFMLVCFVIPTAINFYYNLKKIKRINKKISELDELICNDQSSSIL